jgi:hypothetical protein
MSQICPLLPKKWQGWIKAKGRGCIKDPAWCSRTGIFLTVLKGFPLATRNLFTNMYVQANPNVSFAATSNDQTQCQYQLENTKARGTPAIRSHSSKPLQGDHRPYYRYFRHITKQFRTNMDPLTVFSLAASIVKTMEGRVI